MPLNPTAKLVENILDLNTIEQKPKRDGFGTGLVQAADENPKRRIVLGKNLWYNQEYAELVN